jgi:hypothetical protein
MKKVSFIFALGLSFISPFLLAQSINSVRNEAKTDLQEAIKELAEWRNSIEEEKIPMARRVAALEAKARKLRSQLEHHLRLRDNRETSLLALEKEVKESEGDLDYSLNILSNYITNWYEGTPAAEETLWSKKLSSILLSLNQSTARMKSLDSAFHAMALSIEAIRKTAGGISFPGDAIVPPEGTRESGKFWSIGPIVFFAGDEGSSGFLERDLSKQTRTQGLSSSSVLKFKTARIRPASQNTSNSIIIANQPNRRSGIDYSSLDPTLGKASVMEEGELNHLKNFKKAEFGFIQYYFLLCTLLMHSLKPFKSFKFNCPNTQHL